MPRSKKEDETIIDKEILSDAQEQNVVTNFVSKGEFEDFKKTQIESTNSILDAIKGISKPEPTRAFSISKEEVKVPLGGTATASARSSNFTLNPAHQAILEEYFDPKDGFEGRLDGINFSIIVPMNLSNADPAWKTYYKTDSRMKVLNPNDFDGSIRAWCKLVAGNLKYTKK